ncbi:complex I NDUFA9 subunit family protein [Acidiphilium sp. AL]|uniref:Complex I NDUFA9 subunit family protein n=1 Tax=Acidiphilium iwatense TaxID=768198 RepID=A0ABS9DSM2_9PROT|nr:MULTISPECIES: complex I NDUFA9 subunit family protein [Acidiphilium]MCF3945724.1 complex I NDUFA9 subunit family protein [Acidiphilium iwatense]MCU4159305.1 complex I NDUFA9 subunit family protein [Acidiphilium sp. AL]
MDPRMIATVFGASGFIGRYVVKHLADRGYIVRAATRDPESCAFLRPLGRVGQIVPLYAPFGNEAAMKRTIDGADCVVNLVGILAEHRRGDFDRVHRQGAETVARLAASGGVAKGSSDAQHRWNGNEGGVRSLVHISAIGADPASPSLYASSKGMGEAAVRAAFPQAVILRPSIVFGPEDQFFNRFARMATVSPILPVIEGQTRFQPVYVGDVADAVMAAIGRPDAAGRIFELGGPDIHSFRDLLEDILRETRQHRTLVTIPRWLAGVQAALLERLPGKMLTRDQLLQLRRDNVVAEGASGLQSLGITPTPIRLIVPDYLRRYRPAGLRE